MMADRSNRVGKVDSVSKPTSRQRRLEIVNMATTSGLTSVDELSATLGVTPSTIRRDLALLTTQGKLARTYGGAMSLQPHPEASLWQRSAVAVTAKQAIGRWAADQVRSGETVLLDAGSTAGAMAHSLRDRTEITVATVGLTALQELAEAPGLEILTLGGKLRSLSQGFVGPIAEASLERMTFDRAFMGADGVTWDGGICEADHEQTRLKELMMRRAEKSYVLAHSAKLGQRPFHAWARMPEQWTLVTDSAADPAEVGRFRDNGIEVVVVELTNRPEWGSVEPSVNA